MSFEERLKDFAGDVFSKIDKSIKELLYGHYPDLTEKEFVICEIISSAAWESFFYYYYDMIVQTAVTRYKELFHNTDEVESVIKQLIEKGIVRDEITFLSYELEGKVVRDGPIRCLDIKDEIGYEAFMIYSTHFDSSTSEYFGPSESEKHQ
jgi:hypothetical protein